MMNDENDKQSIYNGSESHLNEDFGTNLSYQNSAIKNSSAIKVGVYDLN